MPKRSGGRSPRSSAHSQAGAKSPARSSRTNSRRLPLLRRRWWALILGLGGVVLAIAFALAARYQPRAAKLRQAWLASEAGDWAKALELWHEVNESGQGSQDSLRGEARASLALGRARVAEQKLRAALKVYPADVELWQLLLEILRAEERTLELDELSWQAIDQVPADSRGLILRELTLGLLSELPDTVARRTLRRWSHSDPADDDARLALLRRIATQPRADDPSREDLLAELEHILSRRPDLLEARAVIVEALADFGEIERGRRFLLDWPPDRQDARFYRLRGRWNLEYDHKPEQAFDDLHRALEPFPQDWRTWYRLARTARLLGKREEAEAAANRVRRLREIVDPLVGGKRLDDALERLNEQPALQDLAALCRDAGLLRLANAWSQQASTLEKKAQGNAREAFPPS